MMKLCKKKLHWYEPKNNPGGSPIGCPECKKVRAKIDNKKYYQKNPEKEKARNKTYREENPEQVKSSKKAWVKANPEKVKVINKKSQDTWQKANPGVAAARASDWYYNNLERAKASRRANYKKNSEKVKASSKIWAKANPESVKANSKKHSKNNPGKVNAQTAKRRATKLQATPKWLTKEQNLQIKTIYIEAAKLTKETKIPYEVDHIIPFQGENVSGLHVPWNLQILPRSKNRSKGNKLKP